MQDLEIAWKSNVVAPALIGKYFLPLLEKGERKVIMNMTSGLASMALDLGSKCSSYSISKTAVNMLVGSGDFGESLATADGINRRTSNRRHDRT